MSASTCSRSRSIPDSACELRRFPSKWKGRVTTATTSAPASFAILARIGEAPVPVPPPMPAVMKTMSVPSKRTRASSWDSSAAFSPTSGLAPAPSPRVS